MSKDTRECNAGNLTFNAWKKKVDETLEKAVNLDSVCLVDIAYWDLWNLGGEPCEAAQEAIWAEWGESNAPILAEYAELHGE